MHETPVRPAETVHDPRFTSAYRRAVGMSSAELATVLKRHLGRPLVALATKTPDANTISRWARDVEPNANAKARMQLLATVLFALEDVWDTTAESVEALRARRVSAGLPVGTNTR
jgi:hypothetical protein